MTQQAIQTITSKSHHAIRPYHVDIPYTELDDLRRRINATKWPERETVTDFSQGVPLATMQAAVARNESAVGGRQRSLPAACVVGECHRATVGAERDRCARSAEPGQLVLKDSGECCCADRHEVPPKARRIYPGRAPVGSRIVLAASAHSGLALHCVEQRGEAVSCRRAQPVCSVR